MQDGYRFRGVLPGGASTDFLIEEHFDVAVLSEFGNVLIYTKGDDRHLHKIDESLQKLPESISGINNIEIHQNVPPHENAI